MRGAREALQRLGEEAGTSIDLHLVWTKVLRGDDRAAALLRATELTHAGVTHYWDGAQLAGRLFKPVLEVGKSPLAWDVYLFFRAGTMWGETAPEPAAWAHQLAGADPARFFGGRLGARLESDYHALRGQPPAEVPAKATGEIITIDRSKLRSVAALLLDDALAELRAKLPEAEQAAFDATAARIRERYAEKERASGFGIPRGVRLHGSIVAVPEPSCAPPAKAGD